MKKSKLKYLAVAPVMIMAFLLATIAIAITGNTHGLLTTGNADSEQTTLVILGDSIAYGTAGILNPAIPNLAGARNYAQIIEDTKGWEVINRARNSGRTRSVEDRDMIELLTGDTVRALGTQADVARADIINISIGGNDLQGINNTNQAGFIFGADALRDTVAEALAKLNGETTATPHIDYLIEYFTHNIGEIIDAIRELNEYALIVWFTNYVPPYHAVSGILEQGTNMMFGTSSVQDAYDASVYVVSRINQAYVDFIKANPGSFILSDAFTAFDGNPFYFNGGAMTAINADIIHPNALGHMLLAALLMETIDTHFNTILEQDNSDLKNQNNSLQNENNNLTGERDTLESENSSLQNANNTLQNNNNTLNNTNTVLQNDNNTLTSQRDALQSENTQLRQELESNDNDSGNNTATVFAVVFGISAVIFAGTAVFMLIKLKKKA